MVVEGGWERVRLRVGGLVERRIIDIEVEVGRCWGVEEVCDCEGCG